MTSKDHRNQPVSSSKGRARVLNVSGVPHDIWQRARGNALASDMTFRDYVIQLLKHSVPIEQSRKDG